MSLETRASDIAGRGLFTTAATPTGTAVLEVDDGVGPLNHSCDPNLGWAGERQLVALRDIAVDEELTVDYATVTSERTFVLYCHCETYRCRQVVEGTDWRIPQLQRRYAGRWTPALQALIDAQ